MKFSPLSLLTSPKPTGMQQQRQRCGAGGGGEQDGLLPPVPRDAGAEQGSQHQEPPPLTAHPPPCLQEQVRSCNSILWYLYKCSSTVIG